MFMPPARIFNGRYGGLVLLYVFFVLLLKSVAWSACCLTSVSTFFVVVSAQEFEPTANINDTLPRTSDTQAPAIGRLSIARLYGGIHDYAYYFLDILVGNPPQRQSVIIDTGSSLLGFPCKDCDQCGGHVDKPFDFSKSTTAEWLACKDSACTSECGKHNRCAYSQRYSEGSAISGNYFKDYIALGDQPRENTFVWFDHLGCHNKETKLFTTQKANGIMGVSFPRHGKSSTIIDSLFGAPDVDSKTFALCIADHGGVMTVGGFNSSLHTPSEHTFSSTEMADAAQKQRLLYDYNKRHRASSGYHVDWDIDAVPVPVDRQLGQSRKAASVPRVAWTKVTTKEVYSIALISMSVLDNVVGDKFGRVIVDSGTTFSYFPSSVYKPIKDALTKLCHSSSLSCRVNSDTDICWHLSEDYDDARKDLEKVPSFILKFKDGASVEWKANSYLYPTVSGRWCAAFEKNYDFSTILGASFMKGKDVIFDRQRNLIGFATANCPMYDADVRPPPPTNASIPVPAKVSVKDEEAVAVATTANTTFTENNSAVPDGTNSLGFWPFTPHSENHVFVRRPKLIFGGFVGLVVLVVSVMVCLTCQTLGSPSFSYSSVDAGGGGAMSDTASVVELQRERFEFDHQRSLESLDDDDDDDDADEFDDGDDDGRLYDVVGNHRPDDDSNDVSAIIAEPTRGGGNTSGLITVGQQYHMLTAGFGPAFSTSVDTRGISTSVDTTGPLPPPFAAQPVDLLTGLPSNVTAAAATAATSLYDGAVSEEPVRPPIQTSTAAGGYTVL